MKKKVFRERQAEIEDYIKKIWDKELEKTVDRIAEDAKIRKNASNKKQEAEMQVTEPKKRGRKKSVKSSK